MKTSLSANRIAKSSLFILLLCGAFLLQSGVVKNKKKFERTLPPGTLAVTENFYMDKDEVSNFAWLEYLYWTSKVYGQNSTEYKACMPDTALWFGEDSCLYSHAGFYLRHPAYRDYPVVGISHKQALAYCDWRSDRVFEYYLIKNGELDWNHTQTPETAFTTERYFSGTYQDRTPNPEVMEVPVYRLPTEAEWNRTQRYFDSVRTVELNGRHFLNWKEVRKLKAQKPVIAVQTCDAGTFLEEPTSPDRSTSLIHAAGHMDGNVSEWLFDPGKAIGANWKDAVIGSAAMSAKPATTLGMRCVCEWKAYKKH